MNPANSDANRRSTETADFERQYLRVFRAQNEWQQNDLLVEVIRWALLELHDAFFDKPAPDDPEERIKAADEIAFAQWPGDWRGRSCIDLDDFGDPGYFLEKYTVDAEGVLATLFGGAFGSDEYIAQVLTEDYLACLEENHSELLTDFGMTEEEMVKAFEKDFIAFLHAWRERILVYIERSTMLLNFWAGFYQHVADRPFGIEVPMLKAEPKMDIPLHGACVVLRAAFLSQTSSTAKNSGGEIRAGIYLGIENVQRDFQALSAQKEAIESELGEELVWDHVTYRRVARIYLRHDADLKDRSRWPEYFEWLREKLEMLNKVFSPRVKAIDVDDQQAAEEV